MRRLANPFAIILIFLAKLWIFEQIAFDFASFLQLQTMTDPRLLPKFEDNLKIPLANFSILWHNLPNGVIVQIPFELF